MKKNIISRNLESISKIERNFRG